MQPQHNALIHLIDDDASVREALAWLLRSRHLSSIGHASVEDFLADWDAHQRPTDPCCLLLDVRMPEMSGVQLQAHLTDMGWHTPIVFISGESEHQEIIEAMNGKIIEYMVRDPSGRG